MQTRPDPARLVAWFDRTARDLPWRRPGVSAWGILVSEVMLQQTPVSRVLPVYAEWMRVWPTASLLAEAAGGDAVRAWGALGYPRRALRLHETATIIDAAYDGVVPDSYQALRTLPGVGDYTASAVLAFAFGKRAVVLDTNVRRVLSRSMAGRALPPRSVRSAERAAADRWLPADPSAAASASVALMELGALVCVVERPRCTACPIAAQCSWLAAGRPAYDGPPRRKQGYAGTDRQCRGAILAVLRAAVGPVDDDLVRGTWPTDGQRERALASLVDDGLVVRLPGGRLSLPAAAERRRPLSPGVVPGS
jgi:A/G-specific adenine glycosylase